MTIALIASPGMSVPLSKIGDVFMAKGIRPYYVILGAGSSSFVREVNALRQTDGRVLPALIEKHAPGADPSTPVFSFGYSAGSWLARDGILSHPADRAQTRGVVYGDGLHANDQQLTTTKDYLAEGGHVLVIHSDVVPGSYPSTGDTARRLSAATPSGQHLTVSHAPGDHTYTSLRMPEKIQPWLEGILSKGGGGDVDDGDGGWTPPSGKGVKNWFDSLDPKDLAYFAGPALAGFILTNHLMSQRR